MNRFLICIALALSAGSAAAYNSGNKLLADLASSDARANINAMNYVNGAWHAIELVGAANGKDVSCTPDGTTLGQVSEAVTDALRRDVANRHLNPVVYIHRALVLNWPCRPKATPQRYEQRAL